ncbi:GNAT family N-acetyltransferase [Bacillus sp. Marseille-P3661]|uniref:GNAT family N-acetyltransferase n=1 Tax=Bacillus sp. Marseille-P3661 TaxID=1936234 RepID=UPI000C817506|nr:GNAT family N-acetyltransferase [Bacillus sp. Marseille-P3661]
MKVIRKATLADVDKMEQIVGQAGLQTEGIVDNVDNFLIMEDKDGVLTAVVGFEFQNSSGLLRSLVLTKQSDQFFILELMKAAFEFSKKQGVETLYLCTQQQSSVDFFKFIGFEKVEETHVEDLNEFEHYKNIVDENPVIMKCSF